MFGYVGLPLFTGQVLFYGMEEFFFVLGASYFRVSGLSGLGHGGWASVVGPWWFRAFGSGHLASR